MITVIKILARPCFWNWFDQVTFLYSGYNRCETDKIPHSPHEVQLVTSCWGLYDPFVSHWPKF